MCMYSQSELCAEATAELKQRIWFSSVLLDSSSGGGGVGPLPTSAWIGGGKLNSELVAEVWWTLVVENGVHAWG